MIPVAVSVDPVGNRLFVSDWQAGRVWTVDAVSGAVQSMHQCEGSCIGWSYSGATNRLYLGFTPATSAALDLGNPDAAPVALPTLPGELRDSAYIVVNDDTRLLYTATVPQNEVHAIDIDPSSPTFHQIVWTGVGIGSSTHSTGYLQPALDPVGQRLYVSDVESGVLNVFSSTTGPSLHQLVQTIPIADHLPPTNQGIGVMVIPEVDPLTGLVYAVVATDCMAVVGYCDEAYRASVLSIDPAVGVVGKVTLPQSFTESPGAFLMIDPGTRRMIVGTGQYGVQIAMVEDLRPSVLATPAATGTSTVSAAEATITFAEVSTSGTMTIASRGIAGLDVQLPGQFTIDGGLLYEISTTATIAGPITLCFSAAHINDPAAFDALHVLHGENGIWVDRTTSRNYPSRTICASTTALSPFAIVKRTTPAYSPRLLYTIDRSFKAGSTIPVKVQVLDWAGANVSSPTLPLKAVTLKRTSDDTALTVEDAGSANPDQDFRYDAELEGYIFNLSTKGLAPGTYTLTADVEARARYIQLPFSVK